MAFIHQLLELVKETNELKKSMEVFKRRIDCVSDEHEIEHYPSVNQYLAEAPITNIFKIDTVGSI